MKTSFEKIEQEAKRLSRLEQERLVTNLVAGLDRMPVSDVDQEWIDEAERRWNDLATGKITAIPAQDVVDEIRTHFGWKK